MGILKANFWTEVGVWLTSAGWNLLHAALIVIGAFVLSWILRVLIRRVVRQIVSGVKKGQSVTDTQALVASPLAAVRVVQRTRTLGSVLSNIVNVTIGIITIILVIEVFAPTALTSFALLTAAIGAGLGFGAQNIVKDVLNGLFMVMEDQLGVGDVVDLGSATGVVEAVGIRVTQVRDVNGTLWFVRNGEILRVGNMSQGWSRVIVDLAVPYDTDIEAVQSAMMEAATALATSPKWRSRILDKPELWGLESVSADAMIIRIVLKTRTTAKDDVSRELRLPPQAGHRRAGHQAAVAGGGRAERLRQRGDRQRRTAAPHPAHPGRPGEAGDRPQGACRCQARPEGGRRPRRDPHPARDRDRARR